MGISHRLPSYLSVYHGQITLKTRDGTKVTFYNQTTANLALDCIIEKKGKLRVTALEEDKENTIIKITGLSTDGDKEEKPKEKTESMEIEPKDVQRVLALGRKAQLRPPLAVDQDQFKEVLQLVKPLWNSDEQDAAFKECKSKFQEHSSENEVSPRQSLA